MDRLRPQGLGTGGYSKKSLRFYIGFTILQDSEFPVLLLEKLAKSLHASLQSESGCEHIIPLAQKVHILLGVGNFCLIV